MSAAVRPRTFGLALCLLAASAAAGSSAAQAEAGSLKFPDASLEPSAWSRLDGWTDDDHMAAFAAVLASCRAILAETKSAPAARRFTEQMKAICRHAKAAPPANEDEARAFFEKNFLPVRIAKVGEPAGFLTGYYEPIVAGSRFPTPEYTVPLYRRPDDLRTAGGRKHKGIFSNKGKVFRKVGRKAVPYYTRAEIEDGALAGRHLEICWLKDPIEAFFISIQGSARIRLEDGTLLRVNYDAHNGQRYLPVGRILIERGEIAKDDMSTERIRQWMLAHPDEGRALRRMNNSYVFYRVTGLADDEEPIGAQGVSLTPVRSIAVDRHLHLYGTPFWIEAELPIESEAPDTKFHRLMVAQDTGSAIVGPARADIYWGAGEEAGLIGGRIKQPGMFTMLVPRALDPFARWRNVPLPPEKPDAAAIAAQPDAPESVPAAARQSALDPVPLPEPKPNAAAAKPSRPKPAEATPAEARPQAKRMQAKKTAPRHERKAGRHKKADRRQAGTHQAESRQAEPPTGSVFSGLAKFFKRSAAPEASATARLGAARRRAAQP